MLQQRGGYGQDDSKQGFTIIEVVLVLAIAGLIFLMVFLAIGAAQRAQRDQQRKNQLGTLKSNIDNWRVNHKGNVIDTEAEAENLMMTYFGSQKDPSTGEPYEMEFYMSWSAHADVVVPPVGGVAYIGAHICGSDAEANPSSPESLVTSAPGAEVHTATYYAIIMRLETADQAFCLDNF